MGRKRLLERKKGRKVAPVIYKIPNFKSTSLTAKTAMKGITLQTTDPANFRLIQKTLTENKTEFHTFSLPEERSLKVVLKGIPTDVTNDKKKTELEIRKFNVTYIRRFGTPEEQMPICHVHIDSSPTAKDIFLWNSLFYIQTSVELIKTSGPA